MCAFDIRMDTYNMLSMYCSLWYEVLVCGMRYEVLVCGMRYVV